MTEDHDYCDSCCGYGDDYTYDENGDLVSICNDCPRNYYEDEDSKW